MSTQLRGLILGIVFLLPVPTWAQGMPTSPHFTNVTRSWSTPKAKSPSRDERPKEELHTPEGRRPQSDAVGARPLSRLKPAAKGQVCGYLLNYTADLLRDGTQDRLTAQRVQALKAWARQWEATVPATLPSSLRDGLEERARALAEKRDREALTTCLSPPLSRPSA